MTELEMVRLAVQVALEAGGLPAGPHRDSVLGTINLALAAYTPAEAVAALLVAMIQMMPPAEKRAMERKPDLRLVGGGR